MHGYSLTIPGLLLTYMIALQYKTLCPHWCMNRTVISAWIAINNYLGYCMVMPNGYESFENIVFTTSFTYHINHHLQLHYAAKSCMCYT